MGAILPGVSIGGPIAAGIFRGRAAEAQADAIASAARFNAAVALEEASLEATRRRRIARQTLATQRLAFAKAGVRIEGTPLELLAQNAAELERDIVNVRIAGRRTAALDIARARNVRETAKTLKGAALLTGLARGAFQGRSLVLRRV